MSPVEIAWLAGLLEGEGSFVTGPPSKPNQPRIAVEMKDRDIIERIALYFGVTYIHNRPAKGKWSECFRITLKGQKAVDLMIKLRPLMGERRKSQIDRAITSHKPGIAGEDARKLSKEQWTKLTQRAQNEPISKLAAEFGVSRSRICKVLAKSV